MEIHSGGVDMFRASEGNTVLLPLRGCVHGTISFILCGVRSTCYYFGDVLLLELTKSSNFLVVQEK
ncbi:GMP reductase, partial [Vibrio parahaemolyticus]|nr:GMP reductase [Vibrio parahaemolyticus]